MKKLLRIVAIAVLGLTLTTGVAAANTGSIGTTGPDSENKIEVKNEARHERTNNNDLRVGNDNPQDARSGRASVKHNTTGGDAESGVAENDSLFRANVTVDNANCGCEAVAGAWGENEATIENTGPDSENKVEFENEWKVEVTNNNSVQVNNTNDQSARSGRARVSGNTTGGNAVSGGASNISTSEVTIEVTN